MKSATRTAVFALLLALVSMTTGCVKFKQITHVMPDGSGKVVLDIGLSDQLMQMAREQGEDPFKELSPEKIAESSKGFAAFTQSKQTKKDGYTYVTFTAYFKDINKIVLQGPEDAGGDSPPPSYTFERDGKSATLTAKNTMILSAVRDHEPIPEDQKQFVAGMMAGMQFSEQYVLPGAADDIDGVTYVDNTAKIEMDADDALNGTGPIQDFKGKDKLVFKIREVTEDDAALKAFKQEMAEAIKAWEKAQKEAEQ